MALMRHIEVNVMHCICLGHSLCCFLITEAHKPYLLTDLGQVEKKDSVLSVQMKI